MIKNTDVTVYHKVGNQWQRTFYKNVWWYSKKNAEINETYSKENDADIRIWNMTNIEDFKIGDIILKGNVNVDINDQFDLDGYLTFNIVKLTNNNYSYNKHIHIVSSLYENKIELVKAVKTKQNNGSYINSYSILSKHKAQLQNLTGDEISATIYGANITKMLRIKTPDRELEQELLTKVGNKQDNISNYYIKINENLYKINSVSKENVDIELINDKIDNIVSL